MKRVILIFLLTLTCIISCSLERTNPLDPTGSSKVYEPPKIDSIWVAGELLTWHIPQYTTSTNDTIYPDGYYVYAAQSYNGKYTRLTTKYSEMDTTFTITDHWYQGFIWFKASSYIVYSDTLEGRLSNPVTKTK
jgi:hypothetical protein